MTEPAARSPAGDLAEVACDAGVLNLPSHDQVILPALRQTGRWEPEETAWIASHLRHGDCLVDLGAHVGYHSLLAARAVGPRGHVVAFEPDPANYECLRLNIARAGLSNVQAFPLAAWRRTQALAMRGSATNTGDQRTYRRATRSGLRVQGIAIDALFSHFRRLDLIKSDLQGRDHIALWGMRRLIARHRPRAVVEFWPEGIRDAGSSVRAAFRTYDRLGFTVRLLGGGPTSLAEAVSGCDAAAGGYVTLELEPR